MRRRSVTLGCDLIKMKLHGLAVAGWQHEGSDRPPRQTSTETDRSTEVC